MSDVVVVGAGRLGSAVVSRLLALGHAVSVLEVRQSRQGEVEAAGARWLYAEGDIRDAVGASSFVLTVLPGSSEVRDAMLGRSGSTYPALLSMLPPDAVWIDMTSAAPEVAADLRAAAREHAVRYVDAAVGGSAADASCGRLSLYLGGADDDVQRASSLLRDLAPHGLKHMGGCGAGYLTKLLINQLWFGQAVIVAEALSLAIAGGLDAAVFAVALSGGPADGAFVRDYLPRMLVDDHLPTFGIDRIVEQLDALERTAAASGVQWTVSGAVADLHRRALRSVGPVEGELLAALHVMRSAVRE